MDKCCSQDTEESLLAKIVDSLENEPDRWSMRDKHFITSNNTIIYDSGIIFSKFMLYCGHWFTFPRLYKSRLKKVFKQRRLNYDKNISANRLKDLKRALGI